MGKGFMTVFLGAEIIVGNMIVDCITIFKMFLYKKKYCRQNKENSKL